MTYTVKQSALALTLLGGAALLVDPVVADTLYDMGDFAGRPKEHNHPLLSGHSIKGRLTPTAMAWSGVPMTTSLALA